MQTIILADLLGGFGVNAVAFLSQLVSFGIVFFILWKWALPTILKTMNRRQAIIQEGIENAERARRELDEATQRAEEVMREARRHAQETVEQAAKAAEGEANRIIEEAHAQADQVAKQQIARIQQEAARARAELNRLVVNLSITAASKVISKSVDSNDNRRLVEEFVSTNQTKEE
ncbi:MAG TPA: F0F1 ATP synthase subunit B [Ktedonobacteraceae bacterium]